MKTLGDRCHRRLKIPVQFQPFEMPVPAGVRTREMLFGPEMINLEVHGWLGSLGLRSRMGRYFYSTPSSVYLLHVDIHDPPGNEFVFLNFVYGGSGSYMTWHDVSSATQVKQTTSDVGTIIRSWDPAECREICRAVIGTPSLINSGIPHTMIPGTETRHCYSLSLSDINGRRMQWDDVIGRFEKFVDVAGDAIVE